MRAMFIKDFNELNVCSKSITSYLCKKGINSNYQCAITRYMDYMNIELKFSSKILFFSNKDKIFEENFIFKKD